MGKITFKKNESGTITIPSEFNKCILSEDDWDLAIEVAKAGKGKSTAIEIIRKNRPHNIVYGVLNDRLVEGVLVQYADSLKINFDNKTIEGLNLFCENGGIAYTNLMQAIEETRKIPETADDIASEAPAPTDLAGALENEETMDCEFNDKIINSEEGRKFIIKIIDFFVNESRIKTEEHMRHEHKEIKIIAKRRYNDYKFIRDGINISTSSIDFYYELVSNAASYIDYIEDGTDPDFYFPLNILSRFKLKSWFDSNIDRYWTDEMIITLVNKIFNSRYRTFFMSPTS